MVTERIPDGKFPPDRPASEGEFPGRSVSRLTSRRKETDMNEFFSWQTLATFAGCSAATAIITQFLKSSFQKLPTQWLSYIIAAVILYAATYFTGALTGASAAIIPLNSILVALASNGAYSAVQRVKNGKPVTPAKK